MSPQNVEPPVFWIVAGPNGLFQSKDRGTSWTQIPMRACHGRLAPVRLAYVGAVATQDGVDGVADILACLRDRNPPVPAILTVIGYSLNDTIVVYDRIRENLKKYRRMPMVELLDLSVNETLARTIMVASTRYSTMMCRR